MIIVNSGNGYKINKLIYRMIQLDNDTFLIDTELNGRHKVGVYLTVDNGSVCLFDTGPGAGIAKILSGLAEIGLTPDKVELILLTHIHLDHAGAVGNLAEIMPNARIGVHPSGHKHLLDTDKLNAGSREVYGEEGLKVIGEMKPVPADRMFVFEDMMDINFGERQITAVETHGHAYHHYGFLDKKNNCFFAGDIAGISYEWLPSIYGKFLFLPSAPSQFDIDAWRASLDKIEALNPNKIFVTHFGETDKNMMFEKMYEYLDRVEELFSKIVSERPNEEELARQIVDLYEDFVTEQLTDGIEHGPILERLQNDLMISTSGAKLAAQKLLKN